MVNMVTGRTKLLVLLLLPMSDVAIDPATEGNDRGGVSPQAEPVRAKPLRPSTPVVDRPPTSEEEAWATTHLTNNWDDIEENYPIESVRKQFVHAIERFRQGEVVPNISIVSNSASEDVLCSNDVNEIGRLRLNFYLSKFRRIQAKLSQASFQDAQIVCLVHENIHLEEQPMMFLDRNRRFSREEMAETEAEAWSKTAKRILVPMRDAGRLTVADSDVLAIRIFDEVGEDWHHARWQEYGRFMSPANPQTDYKE